MSYLGVDIGTSGLRALLVDEAGQAIGAAEQSYATAQPHNGWSEQDPADWTAALDATVARLRAAHPEFAALKGIGVAGHMHGATLFDANGKVLRPCIMWNDTRSHTEAAELDADPAFRALAGNIVFAGFTAPKLAWIKHHEPEVFARIDKVLLPAAALTFHLTGEHVADMSDSAGTAWLNVGERAWSDELLAKSHMKRSQMPRLIEGSAPAGQLRADLAQSWGISHSVTVAGGAGDNAAAACGMGLFEEGEGFVSLGTSGVVLLARDSFQPAPETALHTFCHAVPERWYQMGVMLAAADCLSWLSTITGTAPAALTSALGDTLKPPSNVSFAPYLSGERTPHNDAHIRAGFTGISKATTCQDLTQAVLEGVCFGLRDSFEAITKTGARFNKLYAVGGGSASPYWLQLLATVLNTPLLVPEGGEFGAAMGAARLGMAANTQAPLDTIMHAPDVAQTVQPDAQLAPAFDAAYARFQTLHPTLKKQAGDAR